MYLITSMKFYSTHLMNEFIVSTEHIHWENELFYLIKCYIKLRNVQVHSINKQ